LCLLCPVPVPATSTASISTQLKTFFLPKLSESSQKPNNLHF
jgi:hypothetical protein